VHHVPLLGQNNITNEELSMAYARVLLKSSTMVVLPAIIMVLALLPFASTILGQEPGNISLEQGTDRQGLDYKNFVLDGGAETCQRECASDAKCQAYTWVRSGVQNPKAICWLKDGAPQPSSSANCVSGVKESLPQGITGGLSYYVSGDPGTIVDGSFVPGGPGLVVSGSVDGIQTLGDQSGLNSGWWLASDGDRGLHEGNGFYHKELLPEGGGSISRTPDRYILPEGAACGFHHTQNTPAKDGHGTCMGMDPGQNQCPNGWIARRHFDMSSGNGSFDCRKAEALLQPVACGYFVWCEYTDPYKLCEDPDCVFRATRRVTVGIESNTDDTGAALRQECPAGTIRTSFFDDGRPEGRGLSFCRN